MNFNDVWGSAHRRAYRYFIRVIGLSKDKTSRNLFRLFQVAVYATSVVFLTNLTSVFSSDSSYGTFGDYFGGMLNPILTFLTFMGLLMTIVLQQKELRLTRNELKESSIALAEQAETLALQLEQAKKATSAEFFFKAMEMMQAEDVRSARRLAFELHFDRGLNFNEWTEENALEIEKVCHTFDVVGKLVRFGLVEEKMILSSWHTTIKKSWNSTLGLVENRRRKDGAEFWGDFEWLFHASQNYG